VAEISLQKFRILALAAGFLALVTGRMYLKGRTSALGALQAPATTPLFSSTPEHMKHRGLSCFILSAERSGAGGRWFKSNPRNHTFILLYSRTHEAPRAVMFYLSAERSGAGGRWFKSNPRNRTFILLYSRTYEAPRAVMFYSERRALRGRRSLVQIQPPQPHLYSPVLPNT